MINRLLCFFATFTLLFTIASADDKNYLRRLLNKPNVGEAELTAVFNEKAQLCLVEAGLKGKQVGKSLQEILSSTRQELLEVCQNVLGTLEEEFGKPSDVNVDQHANVNQDLDEEEELDGEDDDGPGFELDPELVETIRSWSLQKTITVLVLFGCILLLIAVTLVMIFTGGCCCCR